MQLSCLTSDETDLCLDVVNVFTISLTALRGIALLDVHTMPAQQCDSESKRNESEMDSLLDFRDVAVPELYPDLITFCKNVTVSTCHS